MQFTDVILGIVMMVCAGLLSFTMTPIVRVLAYKLNAVDVPKDNRRMHKEPVPRLGGLAIFLGFVITSLLFCSLDKTLMGVLAGAVVIVVIGMLDDIFRLPAVLKFFVQIAAACIPAFCGSAIGYINFFGIQINFGAWSIPATVLWIVAITNAVNLIDGLDGLACGVSTISAFSMLAFALLSPVVDFNSAMLTAVLAGACLGFLPFNLNPAKIFMGDTGALFLGYMLANISVMGLFKTNALISFATPFFIFGLPLLDTTFAVIRRVLKGQSPFHADRGHLHHRLIDVGLSQKQTVATLYALSALMGVAGIIFSEKTMASAVILLLVVLIEGIINWRIFRGDDITREHSGLHMKARGGNSEKEEK
ncbi:MAG: undecaprenyl/decaprenyl-phosphate alpha-N-acetylglucosaminyl 1-phosphate transferase [Clostridia bacterium]|nr:undecaprenyl/decaprenyl-phosphate alpha-N-acetylglucosaminyl 1-phosphate transferase [Clostridia bacterium]